MSEPDSLDHFRAAAERAAAECDYARALACQEEVLELLTAATAERAGALLQASKYARRAGQIQGALATAGEALEIFEAQQESIPAAETCLQLADLQWLTGDMAASDTYTRAFGLLESDDLLQDTPVWAWSVARRSMHACMRRSWGEVLPWARAGVELAARLNLPEIESHCLINSGLARAMQGERDPGLAAVQEGRQKAELAGSTEEAARSYIAELTILAREGRYRDACRVAATGADYAARSEAPEVLSTGLAVWRAEYLWLTGQWREALDSLTELEKQVHAQPSDLVRCHYLVLTVRIATSQGNLAEAERLLSSVDAITAGISEPQWVLPARLSQTRLRLAQQKPAEALDCVVDTFDEYGHSGDVGFAELAVLGLEAACRLGVNDEAVAHLSSLVAALPNPRRTVARFYRQMASGFDAFQSGRAEDALLALSAALEAAQRMASPEWEVEVRQWLAAALQQRGADEDGLEAARQRQTALGILQGMPGYAPSDAPG